MWLRTNAEAAACQQAAMETKTAHHGGETVGPQEELIKPSPVDLGFSRVKPIMDLSLDSAHYESTHPNLQKKRIVMSIQLWPNLFYI